MQGVDWRKILEKYTGLGAFAISDDIRTDVVSLVHYAKTCHEENQKLSEELKGARDTVLAMAIQAGGTIDVPFSLIDQLKPTDILHVEDVEVPGSPEPEKVKRFMHRDRSLIVPVSRHLSH